MATLNTLSVVLTGNASQLSGVLRRSAAEVDAFGRNANRAGTVGRIAMAGVAAGAGIAAVGFAYAANKAAEFEAAMLNVTTIDKNVRNSFAQTSAQVLELSRHLPQSAKELAEGLYDVSSSGFQGANSMTVLTASAIAASAGLTTTANSAKAITAVLNAYGLGADQATRVSDTLFQTVNYGVINFEELTGVIADTVGAASAAGVNIEQLGAAVATMTLTGISASEAGTSLNRVLTSLINPNEALLEVSKKLGVSFAEELGDPAIGLQGVLKQLQKASGGSRLEMSKLFTEVRASRGALALTSDEGRNYQRVLDSMGQSAKNTGATQDSLAQQSKGLTFQLEELKNRFNATAIEAGTKVLPILAKLATLAGDAGHVLGDVLSTAIEKLMPIWDDLVDIGKNLFGVFRDLFETAGPLVKIIGGLALEGLITGFEGVTEAVRATTGFFSRHKEIVTALAIVITAALLPAIGALAIAFGRTLYLGLLNLGIGLSRVLVGITAMNPVLLGVAVAVGVAAGAMQYFSRDTRKTTVDVDGLTASIKTLIETGNEVPLQKDILSQITEWKPSNNDKNGIDYLKEYGVNVASLVKNLADPNNAKAFDQFKDGLGETYTQLVSGNKSWVQSSKVIDGLKDSLTSTNPAVRQFGQLFLKLAQDGSVNPKTIQGLAESFGKLTTGIQRTSTAQRAAAGVQKDLSAAQKTAASGDDAYIKSKQEATKADKNWQEVLNENTKIFKVNIDALAEYKAQADITAASISKNLQDNLKLMAGQTEDLQNLIGKGASAELLQKLTAKGPEYVHAAAQDTKESVRAASDALHQIGVQYHTQNQLIARQSNPAAWAAKQAADQKVAFIEWVDGVQSATSKALEILKNYSNNAAPQEVQQGLAAQRDKVLQAYLATLSDPVRQAVTEALGLAKTGSQNTARQIVNALIAAKPEAISQADDLYRKVQKALDQLHGKKLQVILEDLASGNAQKLKQDIDDLIGAVVRLPAGFGVTGTSLASIGQPGLLNPAGRATGGKIPGFDPLGRDDAGLFKLTRGEWVHNANVSNYYGDAKMRAVNEGRAQIIVPGRAQGGAIGDSYRVGISDAGLAAALGGHSKTIQQIIAQINQTIATAGVAAALAGAGAAGPGQSFGLIIEAMRRSGIGFSAALPGLDRGGHSYHEAGQAVDFSGGNMAAMAAWWRGYAPFLLEGIHTPGLYIKNGRDIGPEGYGAATVADHLDHVHIAAGVNAMQTLLEQLGGFAAGGKVGGMATGGPVNQEQVSAYLKSLQTAANVKKYLTGLNKAKNTQFAKFIENATKLEPGVNSLAVKGLQDVYGTPRRNGTWDTALTDFISVHQPHVGAQSANIKFLQLALKRPVTGKFNQADRHVLSQKYAQVFPDGTFLANTLGQDRAQTQFENYLRKIVSRGFAPLAAAIQEKGVESGFAAARQMASAPIDVLRRAQAAAVRTSASSQYGDALQLASKLAQYGGKVGLLGLASRSNTPIADVLGLVTQFPEVFKAMGSTARLLENDLARLKAGKQPIAAYAGGAHEIKKDHIAMVHTGETIMPKAYAEPWRKAQAAGSVGGGTVNHFRFDSITVGDGVSATQVKRVVEGVVSDAFASAVSGARQKKGR